MIKIKTFVLAVLSVACILIPSTVSFAAVDCNNMEPTTEQRAGLEQKLKKELGTLYSKLQNYEYHVNTYMSRNENKLWTYRDYSLAEKEQRHTRKQLVIDALDGIATSALSINDWDLVEKTVDFIQTPKGNVDIQTARKNIEKWDDDTDLYWERAENRIKDRMSCVSEDNLPKAQQRLRGKYPGEQINIIRQLQKEGIIQGNGLIISPCDSLQLLIRDVDVAYKLLDDVKTQYGVVNQHINALSGNHKLACTCEDSQYSCEDCPYNKLNCIAHIDGYAVEGASKGCEVLQIRINNIRENCPLCDLFKVILNADQDMATKSFDILALGFRNVVLIIFALFVAYQTLLTVSHYTKQDTGKYLNTLLTQGFKVLVAVLLLSNSSYIYRLAVSPFMKAGLELGVGMLFDKGINENFTKQTDANISDMADGVIDKKLLAGVLASVKMVNEGAATLPGIGGSLICISMHEASPWGKLRILNFEMFTEGLLLYIFGWLILLACSFYLLDCVVRFGLFCALLPFFIAAWPFKVTENYAKNGWNILLNAFCNFTMIGLIISVSQKLISQAATGTKGNMDQLKDAINGYDIDVLKRMMDISGMEFLILVACCLFAFKMVGQVNQLAKSISDTAGGPGIGAALGGTAASAAKSAAIKAKNIGVGAAKAGGRAAKFAADKSGLTDKIKNSKLGQNVQKAKEWKDDKLAKIGLGKKADANGHQYGKKDGDANANAQSTNPSGNPVTTGATSGANPAGGAPQGGANTDAQNTNPSGNPVAEGATSGANPAGSAPQGDANTGAQGSNSGDTATAAGAASGANPAGSTPQGGDNSKDDAVWNDYSQDTSQASYDKDGNYTGSKRYSADGRLRSERNIDKDGNEHFKNYDKNGELSGERHVNKDGSENGWQRNGKSFEKWSDDGKGNKSSEAYYDGHLINSSSTQGDNTSTE